MANLVIVESPAKARTIARMLGKNYDVRASMGHIRDLPERELGVDLANDFAPQYVDTPRSAGVVKQLKSAAKTASAVYLASDPDREGEAIAWHLREALKKSTSAPFQRVSFHEITRSAIEAAMAGGGEINQDLVDAQQARRVLDRIVGYQVSPLLWRKIEKGSSAGRVQSAALRLVVERERAIQDFKPEEYWEFNAKFLPAAGIPVAAKLSRIAGKEVKITSSDAAAALERAVRQGSAPVVKDLTKQERRRNAPPPFTTSTLQQAANSLLHFSASSTMTCAQQLYEGIDLGSSGAVGLITYMRTDSVNVAKEAQIAAAEFIAAAYGKAYVPAAFNRYRSKSGAQEAHEAVRPTDVRRTPEAVAAFLSPVQLKLYTLIWRRFVASQMAPAHYDQTAADILTTGSDGKEYLFRSVATVLTFPGFTAVYKDGEADESAAAAARALGTLTAGENVVLKEFKSEQKFTEPPARYTEATLVKALEENGIGRPSTYATILRTIQDREYVQKAQNKLSPTETGFQVNDFLTGKLPQLFDIGFTAKMEEQLDEVEEGKLSWVEMMQEFYAKFAPWLKAAKESGDPLPERVVNVLELVKKLEFAPPHKVGGRTYDDRKFCTSIAEKFAQDHRMSERQFSGLLTVAARYAEQLSETDLAVLDAEARAIYDQAVADLRRRQEQRRTSGTATAVPGELDGVFAAFARVNFEPPVVRGKRTYDDKKFFTSLKKQVQSGRALSEKQLSALVKLVNKYAGEVADAPGVLAKLGAVPAPESAAPGVSPDEVKALLAELAQVRTWAEPSGKGRFHFDDRKFYESLARQFREGRTLSPKQAAALRKLAGKYRN